MQHLGMLASGFTDCLFKVARVKVFDLNDHNGIILQCHGYTIMPPPSATKSNPGRKIMPEFMAQKDMHQSLHIQERKLKAAIVIGCCPQLQTSIYVRSLQLLFCYGKNGKR